MMRKAPPLRCSSPISRGCGSAASRPVSRDHIGSVLAKNATGREIRPGDELGKLLEGRLRTIALLQGLRHVSTHHRFRLLGADTGRHADRNAGRAVATKKIAGKTTGSEPCVIGVAEVDGVFVNVFQKRRATSVIRASV